MEFAKHFKIQELVPPSIYNFWGERSIYFLDNKMVKVLDFLRELTGKPITVNNWHEGGQRDEAGFRLPDTATGGRLSQHKFGRAADPKVEDMTPGEVYELIIKNEKQFMNLGLTTVEDIKYTPTWIHFDTRWTGLNFIQVVKP